MRQIKFRGIDAETGETVYGYPVVYDEGMYTHWLYRPNERTNCPVKPDTLAQLVYVKDGVEYFEGDTMIKDGREWQVELCMRWNEVTT